MQTGASLGPTLQPSHLLLGLVTHLLGDMQSWSDRLKDLLEDPSVEVAVLFEFLLGRSSSQVSVHVRATDLPTCGQLTFVLSLQGIPAVQLVPEVGLRPSFRPHALPTYSRLLLTFIS